MLMPGEHFSELLISLKAVGILAQVGTALPTTPPYPHVLYLILIIAVGVND